MTRLTFEAFQNLSTTGKILIVKIPFYKNPNSKNLNYPFDVY